MTEALRYGVVVGITAALVRINPAAPVWAAALIIAVLVLFAERAPEEEPTCRER